MVTAVENHIAKTQAIARRAMKTEQKKINLKYKNNQENLLQDATRIPTSTTASICQNFRQWNGEAADL